MLQDTIIWFKKDNTDFTILEANVFPTAGEMIRIQGIDYKVENIVHDTDGNTMTALLKVQGQPGFAYDHEAAILQIKTKEGTDADSMLQHHFDRIPSLTYKDIAAVSGIPERCIKLSRDPSSLVTLSRDEIVHIHKSLEGIQDVNSRPSMSKEALISNIVFKDTSRGVLTYVSKNYPVTHGTPYASTLDTEPKGITLVPNHQNAFVTIQDDIQVGDIFSFGVVAEEENSVEPECKVVACALQELVDDKDDKTARAIVEAFIDEHIESTLGKGIPFFDKETEEVIPSRNFIMVGGQVGKSTSIPNYETLLSKLEAIVDDSEEDEEKMCEQEAEGAGLKEKDDIFSLCHSEEAREALSNAIESIREVGGDMSYSKESNTVIISYKDPLALLISEAILPNALPDAPWNLKHVLLQD